MLPQSLSLCLIIYYLFLMVLTSCKLTFLLNYAIFLDIIIVSIKVIQLVNHALTKKSILFAFIIIWCFMAFFIFSSQHRVFNYRGTRRRC